MRRAIFVFGALVTLATGLTVVAGAMSGRAQAQVYYQCPAGYYFDPSYGCLPLSYFYGPPYYPYPDFGFDFFYGPGYRGGGFRPGVGPRGGGARGFGGGGGGRR